MTSSSPSTTTCRRSSTPLEADRLVTLTIGGNDSSVFINTITSCGTAGLSTGGMGSPCKDQYGSSFADTIREKTFPALVKTLKAIHPRAKRAKVAILGYPWIMPETKGCFTQMPVAEGDVRYVHHIQWVLNHSVRKAARRTGTRYINFNRASEGHDACKPIGVRWIEPVIGTTNPVVVHPNALGEAEMADRVTEAAPGLTAQSAGTSAPPSADQRGPKRPRVGLGTSLPATTASP